MAEAATNAAAIARCRPVDPLAPVIASMESWADVGNVPIDQVREWRDALKALQPPPAPDPQQIVQQYVALTRLVRAAEGRFETARRDIDMARFNVQSFWREHGRHVPLGAYLVEDGTHALVVDNGATCPPLVAVALVEDQQGPRA